MKVNPVAEVMKDRGCAKCANTSVQNQVYRFIGSDNRRISLCNACVVELRRRASARGMCAFCGAVAKYATWKLDTFRSMGTLTFDEGVRVPEFWLLCEVHFSYLHTAASMRREQTQLKDYV